MMFDPTAKVPAEDGALLLVEPVAFVIHAVLVLYLEILLVGAGNGVFKPPLHTAEGSIGITSGSAAAPQTDSVSSFRNFV